MGQNLLAVMPEEFKMFKIGSSSFSELVEHEEQLPLPNNTNQNSIICEYNTPPQEKMVWSAS